MDSFSRNLYSPVFEQFPGNHWKMASMLESFRVSSLMTVTVGSDPDFPEQQILYFSHGLTTFASLESYQDDAVMQKYSEYILALFSDAQGLSLHSTPDKILRSVLTIEQEASKSFLKLGSGFKKYQISQLNESLGSVPWNEFISGFIPLISDVSSILVIDPDSFSASLEIIRKADPVDLENYILYRVLHAFAPLLTTNMSSIHSHFYSNQSLPRDVECLGFLQDYFPDEIGKRFVERRLVESAKLEAFQITQRMKSTVLANLGSIDWMDDYTRNMTKSKLEEMIELVGYPDQWRSYSSAAINPDDFFETMLAATKSNTELYWNQIADRGDRKSWKISSFSTNAYYDTNRNVLTLPAGILQPIVFKDDFPSYVNFAGLGVTIGHYLSQYGFSVCQEMTVLVPLIAKEDLFSMGKRTTCGQVELREASRITQNVLSTGIMLFHWMEFISMGTRLWMKMLQTFLAYQVTSW
jgi:predicted metalloendopeptidase